MWVLDSDVLKEACVRWGPDPHAKGQLLGERTCLSMPDDTVSCAKMDETDQFGVWVVDSGGLKEAQVFSYSHGGASLQI